MSVFTPGQIVQVADHRHPLYGHRGTVQTIQGDAVELATSDGSHWLAASQVVGVLARVPSDDPLPR